MPQNAKLIIAIKVFILIAIAVNSVFSKPVHMGDKPPYIIYPAISLLILMLSLLYFKLASANYKLIPGKFSTFSSHVFINPLPAFHFIAMAALVSGVSALLSKIIAKSEIDPFTYISLAFGIGSYVSITIANNIFATK